MVISMIMTGVAFVFFRSWRRNKSRLLDLGVALYLLGLATGLLIGFGWM